MKPLLPSCLGIALWLAASPADLAAQGVPKLLSQPPPPALPAPAAASAKAKETDEQKAKRHTQELRTAQGRITQLAKEFPLLTGPTAEAQLAQFKAELAKLQSNPEFRLKPPAPPKLAPAQLPERKTGGQLHAERQEADLALMRKQADQVLAVRPELRDYVEQQFQWHRRLFELGGQHLDNPQVHQLIRSKLGATPPRRK
jgi:uncharacterized protein (DUF1684 family)